MNAGIPHHIGSSQPAGDASLLAEVERDLTTLLAQGFTSQRDGGLIPGWSSRTSTALQRLTTTDGSMDIDALRNFRRDQILVDDLPRWNLSRKPLKNNIARYLLVGWRRATRNCLLECLRVLRAQQFDYLLQRYPCPPVGNPDIFRYRGYRYTFRWARHIYFLGLLNSVLRDSLRKDAVVLDIGSSYGIFSGLVKREYPASHHVLVDLPEQLILARYFLGSWFPGTRIAGVSELLQQQLITKDLLLDYDFVLVPTSLFARLSANTVDLVTNFASLSEMTRDYFSLYLQSEVFQSSKYFYTINRIEAKDPESYGTDVSILDFPISDSQRRLHFGICPIFSVRFRFVPRRVFFVSHRAPPPYFEYIGHTQRHPYAQK